MDDLLAYLVWENNRYLGDLLGQLQVSQMQAQQQAVWRQVVFEYHTQAQRLAEIAATDRVAAIVVAHSLLARMKDQGLVADFFVELQDKQLLLSTQRMLKDIQKQSYQHLPLGDRRRAEQCVQILVEISILEKIIPAQEAKEQLQATDEEWRRLDARRTARQILGRGLLILGVIGILLLPWVTCRGGAQALALASGDLEGDLLRSLVRSLILLALPPVSAATGGVLLSRRWDRAWRDLAQRRQRWQQVPPPEKVQGFAQTSFGNLGSAGFTRLLQLQRQNLRSLLLGPVS